MILVLDYGFGNKTSLSNALSELNIPHKISNNFKDIKDSTHIILPGVGSFGSAMKIIKNERIIDALQDAVLKKKKLLGICLGMQLLFEDSEESKGIKGMNFLKGKIKKIKKTKILPHIGWKKANYKKNINFQNEFDLKEKFYFLHSYMLATPNKYIQANTTFEGQKIPAIISSDSIIGVQFHPERSGRQGLKFLKDFYIYI